MEINKELHIKIALKQDAELVKSLINEMYGIEYETRKIFEIKNRSCVDELTQLIHDLNSHVEITGDYDKGVYATEEDI